LGLVLLRRPIVALLFERGEFDANSTELVAWALLWYAAGLVGHAIVEITSRAYYALQDTRTPVLIGAAAMTLNVALSLALSSVFPGWGWAPHGGLALANTIATSLETVALLWLLRHRIDFDHLRSGLLASAVAAGALALTLLLWNRLLGDASVWLVGLGGVLIGGGVYWLAALVLGSPEVHELPKTLLSRRSG
jgi:putative peptidoglycan lipid II flippase